MHKSNKIHSTGSCTSVLYFLFCSEGKLPKLSPRINCTNAQKWIQCLLTVHILGRWLFRIYASYYQLDHCRIIPEKISALVYAHYIGTEY